MKKYANIKIIIVLISVVITSVYLADSALLASSGQKNKTHKIVTPVRIAISPEGNLFVSDYRLKMILTVNRKTLTVTSKFDVSGNPLAVNYAEGKIYVGNESKKCVEVYNRRGRKMYNLSSPGGIKKPTDIAIDAEAGQIFVLDGIDRAVKVFSFKRKLLFTIPDSYPNDSILANPTGIAVDSINQEIFVSDYGDETKGIRQGIRIFNYDGAMAGNISGKQGWFGSTFSRPQGLAVNGYGNIFFVDCFSGEIFIYDRITGQKIKTLGGFGSEPGQLRLPLDLVINPKTNDIYVTDYLNKRIEVFKKGGLL